MNLEEFTGEARLLAKPAKVLRTEGSGEPLAYWHGLTPGTPCISFQHGQDWLSVHLDDNLSGRVVREKEPVRSSTPLFAESVITLPPVDAIFMFGTPAVEAYLNGYGWDRTDSYNSSFPDKVPDQYEYIWQKSCPLFTSGIAAVCGGWNFPWPYDDFADLAKCELLLWTIKDAEPWVEVFFDGSDFIVMQRIT